MLYSGIFGLVLKQLLSFLKSVRSNFSAWKVSEKNKKYLRLEQKMLYLDIFGRKFEKSFMFETSTLRFVLSESLVQKYQYLS